MATKTERAPVYLVQYDSTTVGADLPWDVVLVTDPRVRFDSYETRAEAEAAAAQLNAAAAIEAEVEFLVEVISLAVSEAADRNDVGYLRRLAAAIDLEA